MNELLSLFLTFARIGGLTFGGGYAMLPMLQKEVVEAKQWATEEELMDYYAIGQCTPGIIAINTATFIGYKRKGLAGALFATYGVVAPSWVIIMIIAAFISNFADKGGCVYGDNAQGYTDQWRNNPSVPLLSPIASPPRLPSAAWEAWRSRRRRSALRCGRK